MNFNAWIAAAALSALASTAHAGERAAATVECKPAEAHLTFSCMIMVKGRKSGVPVIAEKLKVKADMPTMPMAHNVPPAHAIPVEGKPGMYRTEVELEMFGEWALAIDVDGMAGDEKIRDKVIVKREFGKAHAAGSESDHGQHGHGGNAHKKHSN